MICRDIAEHLKSVGEWVNWTRGVDSFKAGDSARTVHTVAVAWKASLDALREAHEKGAELFVSHESIGVNADSTDHGPEVEFALPSEKPKFEWLEQTGMVVYRCHDFWDRFPQEGIRDSWHRGLELGGTIVADNYPLYVTEIEPTTVSELARHVLARTRTLGQNGVMVTGDTHRKITRLATGTGVTTNPVRMRDFGAEAGIITDDFYRHVRMGEHSREIDFPTIMVNHGVAEEWGVANLAAYLKRTFPKLEVFHIPQKCIYSIVTG